MIDFEDMEIKVSYNKGMRIKKEHIERIYRLFNKPSVEPVPEMERERVFLGETNLLKEDVMIYRDNELLVVRWDTINRNKVFAKGISFYFPEEKIKVSALFDKDGGLVKYYCEVVEADYNKDSDKYVFRDLIVDVDLYEDGTYEELDEDQLKIALEDDENEIITPEKSREILRVKDNIIRKIHEGNIIPEWCIKKVEEWNNQY